MISKFSEHEDEIDLFDLLKIIWDKKILIILVIFISLIAAFGYNYKQNQNPKLFEISLSVFPNENTEFINFVNINRILNNNNFNAYEISNNSVFQKFINNLTNYEVIKGVLKKNIYVKNKIANLPASKQNQAINIYVKSLKLDYRKQSNNEPGYTLSFKWHNSDEGLEIINELLNESIFQMNKGIIDNLDKIIKVINKINTQNDIERVDFLEKHLAIAKGLNIYDNQLKTSELAQSIDFINNNNYFLLGHKVIDTEINLIQNRQFKQEIFLSEEVESLKKLEILWIRYNLNMANINLLNSHNSSSVLIISMILGLIIGIILAFIFNAFQVRNLVKTK